MIIQLNSFSETE